ncbi:MAG: hypothetical protein LBF05_06330 [Tannerella sp.]|jgi:hypothetical protein|nr:hypothetical protein [Tannerella sp.]
MKGCPMPAAATGFGLMVFFVQTLQLRRTVEEDLKPTVFVCTCLSCVESFYGMDG